MKLMEHVAELRADALKRRGDCEEVLKALDRVEAFVLANGGGGVEVMASTEPIVVMKETQAALVPRARDTGYGFDPELAPKQTKGKATAKEHLCPTEKGAGTTLAGVLRDFAGRVMGESRKFTRSQAETWVNDAHPAVATKHISAQLSTLVTQGQLLSEGKRGDRVYWWNAKGMAGRAGKGKAPFRKQIQNGCAEAKAKKGETSKGTRSTASLPKKGEQAGRLRHGPRDAGATVVARRANEAAGPTVGIEEAIGQAATVLKQDFSRAMLEDWIERNHPGLIQRELARDKFIIGGTIGKLVDKGTLVRTQEPNALAGKVALYRKG